MRRYLPPLPLSSPSGPTSVIGTSQASQIEPNRPAPTAAGIICLLDDDPSMLRALDRLLSSAGLQAQLFGEPLGFLSYVIYNSVALAVIDIWMSDMSGLAVQKKLQAVSPKTRVIAAVHQAMASEN